MFRKSSRSNSRINLLRPLARLLVAWLSFAASVPFPTYQVGANQNGSQGPNYPSTLPDPWVVSNGQIITPVGTQVYLGDRRVAQHARIGGRDLKRGNGHISGVRSLAVLLQLAPPA